MKIPTILLMTTYSLFLFGNQKEIDRIPVEVLVQKEHPLEKDADASYLEHDIDIRFVFISNQLHIIRNHHERIKVYNDQGESYANFVVDLYQKGRDRAWIDQVVGVTYNYESGRIVESWIEEEDIFSFGKTNRLVISDRKSRISGIGN